MDSDEKADRCGVCFQAKTEPDDWCDVCGLAAHYSCGQFEGNEAPESSVSPFRIDVDKASKVKACGYCRAAIKVTNKGAKEMPPRSTVVCEHCGKSGDYPLLVALIGAATKWVHVCCARYLPGSSIGLTGARKFSGNESDVNFCVICESREGFTTSCCMCDEERAQSVHVFCALSRGNYGLSPPDIHGQKRIVCPEHSTNLEVSVSSTTKPVAPPKPIELKNDHCGVCLGNENLESCLRCDGCDVLIHHACLLGLTENEPFYCHRCSHQFNIE